MIEGRQSSLREVEAALETINSVENGKFDPSLPLAFRIADAFGLTIEELFERDEEDTAGFMPEPGRRKHD